ncbi:hypothetical protein CN917_02005 [Bacillus thuringiensis]|uniref:Uncharacterized protein n=1 Tax=Bacillus thuringiensis TaxID=1428 RepID=A0ABD6RG56_BACTU|nr:hypothetical protein CSW12_17460 [Bacillus cereus]OPD55415.1 hypothetical protein BVF97_03345 [Bacillus thuringiensis]OTZ86132.1 hypothetical protein BK771_16500 [Bacillus thuringiensis serovar ostriniae]PDY56502.1 hypothetical protein COM87_24700 [Bacillus thuringiensis]PDZ63857.1 hypothetical protein CON29_10840 [Bacillus thuringiensis]
MLNRLLIIDTSSILIFSMLLPYSLPKKMALIIFVLILGAISLGANKVVGRIHNKFKQ